MYKIHYDSHIYYDNFINPDILDRISQTFQNLAAYEIQQAWHDYWWKPNKFGIARKPQKDYQIYFQDLQKLLSTQTQPRPPIC